MRVSNKMIYALLCDMQCELEILREQAEKASAPRKRRPGRPKKSQTSSK